jgi:hypothetical protein
MGITNVAKHCDMRRKLSRGIFTVETNKVESHVIQPAMPNGRATRRKGLCVSAIALWLLAGVNQTALSQTWVATSAPTNFSWNSIACSASGSCLIAAGAPCGESAVVYISTNSGSSWISNSPPDFQFFPRVASSSDGTKLVEAAWSDQLGISTNFGKEWNWGHFTTNVLALYGNIASSADGSTLATANGYVSTNFGAAWTNQNFYWDTIAMSADGATLIASSYTPGYQDVISIAWGPPHRDTGSIYVSANWGHSWIKTSAPSLHWNSIACSANATRLIAAADERIYTSADSGKTWKKGNAPGNLTCFAASSTDGMKLAAAGQGGLGLSSNGGEGWTLSPAPDNRTNITALACSADGSRVYVAFDNGGIYAVQTGR